MTLDQLKVGQTAKVVSVKHDGFSDQCGTLGIDQGASIQVLRRAPVKGPLQVKVVGTLYAIRPTEAQLIEVDVA